MCVSHSSTMTMSPLMKVRCGAVLCSTAIGCPDVDAPAGGWLQRTDQTVLMGCSHSSETWQLYCQDFTWVGQMRNCSPGTAAAATTLHYIEII